MTARFFKIKTATLASVLILTSAGFTPANAAPQQDINAPTSVSTVIGNSLQCGADLQYKLQFDVNIDLNGLVAKWRDFHNRVGSIAALRPAFNDGKVTAAPHTESPAGTKFAVTFKLDQPELITVNQTVLADRNLWQQAFNAANGNHSFTNSMIVDPVATPSYDATSGVVTVPFTLREGLSAGDLNRDFLTNGLTTLKVRTPEGLLGMTRAQLIDALQKNIEQINVSKAKAVGTINIQRYQIYSALTGLADVGAIDEHFPMKFSQEASGPVPVYLSKIVAAEAGVKVTSHTGAETDKAATLRASELLATVIGNNPLPELLLKPEDRSIANLADFPQVMPVRSTVDQANVQKQVNGVLLFTGWDKTAAEGTWAASDETPYCYAAPVNANFSYFWEAKVQAPEFTLPQQCDGEVKVTLPEGGKGLAYKSAVNADKSVTVTATLETGFVLPEGVNETELKWKSAAPKSCEPPAEEPPVVKPPVVEPPATEPPKAEVPKIHFVPKVAPTVPEKPRAEIPTIESPKAEVPRTQPKLKDPVKKLPETGSQTLGLTLTALVSLSAGILLLGIRRRKY